MQKIAVFDFDGTIYHKDSLIEFCKYVYSKYPYRLLFVFFQILALLAYKSKLISTTKFKSLFLIYLYGMNQNQIHQLTLDFWNREFPRNFNTLVLNLLNDSVTKNLTTLCVSASPDFMFSALKTKLNFKHFICTNTKQKKKSISIIGENCRGLEKINRIQQIYPDGYSLELAVSDNYDDQQLLLNAKIGFQVNKGKLIKLKHD